MPFIANIVCTKDRPKDLFTLLSSLVSQTRKPDLVIIVDGSDNPISDVVEQFKTSLKLDYVQVRPPGLTKQRNVGISRLPPEAEWVGFLDDDLVLENEAIQGIEDMTRSDPEAKGIGLVINNQADIKFSFYRSLFLMDKEPGGVFTPSGINAAIRPVKRDLRVEWIYGGATFWHSEILRNFKFDEWFSGVGYFEDVDFSYRVSRIHKITLSAKARCWHYHHAVRKEKMFSLGQWQIVAWWYFISKYQGFNKLIVLWSMGGVALSNLINGLLKPSSNRLRSAWGNVNGLLVILKGKVHQFQGFQK